MTSLPSDPSRMGRKIGSRIRGNCGETRWPFADHQQQKGEVLKRAWGYHTHLSPITFPSQKTLEGISDKERGTFIAVFF